MMCRTRVPLIQVTRMSSKNFTDSPERSLHVHQVSFSKLKFIILTKARFTYQERSLLFSALNTVNSLCPKAIQQQELVRTHRLGHSAFPLELCEQDWLIHAQQVRRRTKLEDLKKARTRTRTGTGTSVKLAPTSQMTTP